jgi:hypothetical protein
MYLKINFFGKKKIFFRFELNNKKFFFLIYLFQILILTSNYNLFFVFFFFRSGNVKLKLKILVSKAFKNPFISFSLLKDFPN